MKKNKIHIAAVLDRSGSMSSIIDDMIGGFNNFINKQKENKLGECFVSVYQFDDIYDKIYENVDINNVVALTKDVYFPRGCTALLDAVGRTICNLGSYLSDLKEEDRPEKVIVLIVTDGLENSSKEYVSDKIKEMITHQRDVYKWEFVFLGANIDIWNVGESIGIVGNNTLSYASTGISGSYSTCCMWDSVASTTSNYRAGIVKTMAFDDKDRKVQEDLIKTNKP